MKIGEMSKKTGLSEYTLRYYEDKGLIRVKRDEFDRREYEESEIEWILFIKRLKETGMILRNIKKYSDLRYLGDSTIEERMEILNEHRKIILYEQKKWKDYLENIDNKINIYKEKLK
ncbi:MerR family transcriptional regulator [uncultured Clostridium sp.]|uniref:MerR family transcriptional regulator n=1 Tax=uncultured Clostridium sp. TaxID=59620 RepID=UPI00262B0EA5|nr:MerR family transcriptional regulator [uncultured Clostridium sp.]